MVWKDGSKYVGNFENDFGNGSGKLIFGTESNLDYYEGQWKQTKRSGPGTMVWKDGAKYVGNFEDDLKNGYGKLTFPTESNLDYYEGQ